VPGGFPGSASFLKLFPNGATIMAEDLRIPDIEDPDVQLCELYTANETNWLGAS